MEQKVFEGLRVGGEALKQLNEATRLADVERLMDDTADAVAYQRVRVFIYQIVYFTSIRMSDIHENFA